MTIRESANRCLSQVYKLLILVRYNPFRLLDITIWPLMIFLSVALFAFSLTNDVQVIGIVLLGSCGWRMLYQFQMEPSLCLMDEYWDHSLEHLMVSPIRVWEILIGGFVSAIAKSLFVIALFIAAARLVFDYALVFSTNMVIGLFALALSGVIMAIISVGIIFLKGSQSYGYLFAVSDVLAAFSGVFYSISVFPIAVQRVVFFLPTTHGFELLRQGIGAGQAHMGWLIATLAVWLVIAVAFCSWALRKARREGLLVRMQ